MTGDRRTIRVATAIVVDAAGHLLVVRKRGTAIFMQPGGKIEPGETPLAAMIRELSEEVGLTVAPQDATYLGTYRAAAANEPGHLVEAETFAVVPRGPVSAGGEIAELRWIDPADRDASALAPLILDHVVPTLDFAAAAALTGADKNENIPPPFVSIDVEKR